MVALAMRNTNRLRCLLGTLSASRTKAAALAAAELKRYKIELCFKFYIITPYQTNDWVNNK